MIHEWSTERLMEVACGEDHHPSLPSRRDALAELQRRAGRVAVKPLNWTPVQYTNNPGRVWHRAVWLGLHIASVDVLNDDVKLTTMPGKGEVVTWYRTVDDAKRAAQGLWDTMVRSTVVVGSS